MTNPARIPEQEDVLSEEETLAPSGAASWESSMSESDREVWDEWDYLNGRAHPELDCWNCKMRKPLRSSGRCYACEKYFQRSKKRDERPQGLILREIERGTTKRRLTPARVTGKRFPEKGVSQLPPPAHPLDLGY